MLLYSLSYFALTFALTSAHSCLALILYLGNATILIRALVLALSFLLSLSLSPLLSLLLALVSLLFFLLVMQRFIYLLLFSLALIHALVLALSSCFYHLRSHFFSWQYNDSNFYFVRTNSHSCSYTRSLIFTHSRSFTFTLTPARSSLAFIFHLGNATILILAVVLASSNLCSRTRSLVLALITFALSPFLSHSCSLLSRFHSSSW
jgi:hypothetical protein